MHPWHEVSWGSDVREFFNGIVEIPEGSKVKYELDKATGLLRADRVLYSAVHYPANYGFIPQTYCDDGDPLDVLMLCQEPLAPLSIVRCRAIGVLPMRDDRGQDDKILAVHIDDPQFAHYRAGSRRYPRQPRKGLSLKIVRTYQPDTERVLQALLLLLCGAPPARRPASGDLGRLPGSLRRGAHLTIPAIRSRRRTSCQAWQPASLGSL